MAKKKKPTNLRLHSIFIKIKAKQPMKERENTLPYSNILGARRRQKKDGGGAEEDVAKHIPRRPGTDVCQLAWSPQDRQ